MAAYRATREQEFNARVSAVRVGPPPLPLRPAAPPARKGASQRGGASRAQQGSNSGSATARLQSESDATVARLTQQMAASKDAVVSKLVRAVTTVTA